MSWKCACGIENSKARKICSGCGWTREKAEAYIPEKTEGPIAEEDGFIKKGKYERIVYIPNPVEDEMAMYFIKNDVNVIISEQGRQYFHFILNKLPSGHYINIFYSAYFVGRYSFHDLVRGEVEYNVFSENFVRWLVSNAWD